MDPRHKLTKSLDQLFVDSSNPTIMSARTDDEAVRNAANSGVTPEAIKQKLEANLGATHVEIEDLSGMYCFPHLDRHLKASIFPWSAANGRVSINFCNITC